MKEDTLYVYCGGVYAQSRPDATCSAAEIGL